jgi:hypothetical protein
VDGARFPTGCGEPGECAVLLPSGNHRVMAAN